MHELQAVAVSALDWTMFGDQMRMSDVAEQECLQIYIVGFLVYEDDDVLALAQQVFNEELPNVRFTVMVPKVCIIDRKYVEFFPKKKK